MRAYDPGDIEALTRQLRAVLENPTLVATLVTAAHRRAEEFSQDATLPALEQQLALQLR
jgi:hypothetical protein